MTFWREDTAGKPVKVEFWVENGTITMVRRTTYYQGQRKFRQDLPSDCPGFETALKEEIAHIVGQWKSFLQLMEAVEAKNEPEPEEPSTELEAEEPAEPEEDGGLNGLAYTAALLRAQQF